MECYIGIETATRVLYYTHTKYYVWVLDQDLNTFSLNKLSQLRTVTATISTIQNYYSTTNTIRANISYKCYQSMQYSLEPTIIFIVDFDKNTVDTVAAELARHTLPLTTKFS